MPIRARRGPGSALSDGLSPPSQRARLMAPVSANLMVPTSATHSPVRLRYPAVAANPCGRNNNPLRAHPVFAIRRPRRTAYNYFM